MAACFPERSESQLEEEREVVSWLQPKTLHLNGLDWYLSCQTQSLKREIKKKQVQWKVNASLQVVVLFARISLLANGQS